MSRKRPAVEALESTPPITPQSVPPAPMKEPIRPPEMAIVDVPMVEQEPLVPLQTLASNSKSYRNYLAHECKHRRKALLAKHADL